MKTARLLPLAIAIAAASSWSKPAGAQIAVIGQAKGQGYTFTNFDGPTPNVGGTFVNGISNAGTVAGFTTPDGATVKNFTANPLLSTTAGVLNISNSPFAMANGVNASGTVVGTDGNNHAFTLAGGNLSTYIPFSGANPPNNGVSAVAFGINDKGLIVGQYTTNADITPGYVLSGTTVTTINAPTGIFNETVNAQGINGHGLVVGFYVGADGQDHGFTAQYDAANPPSTLTGTPIVDPTIPSVPGEPGATFVFSQILGINDQGIAVGYYGDSTTSQHGFLYDTNTGRYTFLDDPSERFGNGVEITQITGINNAGEIAGFYTDANGVAHGFVASAVPEPGSIGLLVLGASGAVGYRWRRRMAA